MRAITKQILSELQRIDSGESPALLLSPEIYPRAAVEEARRLLGDPSGFRPLGGDVWSLPARESGDVLSCALILAVRGLP